MDELTQIEDIIKVLKITESRSVKELLLEELYIRTNKYLAREFFHAISGSCVSGKSEKDITVI